MQDARLARSVQQVATHLLQSHSRLLRSHSRLHSIAALPDMMEKGVVAFTSSAARITFALKIKLPERYDSDSSLLSSLA